MIFQFVYYTSARETLGVRADLRDPEYARLEGSADDEDDDEDEDEDEGEGRGEGEGEGLEERREGEGANAAREDAGGGGARRGRGAFARAAPSRRSRRGPSLSPSLSRSASSFPVTGSARPASKAGRTIRTPRPRGPVREDLLLRGIRRRGFRRGSTRGGPSTRRGRRSGARSARPAPWLGSRISQIVGHGARRSCEGSSAASRRSPPPVSSRREHVLRATSWGRADSPCLGSSNGHTATILAHR